MRLPPQRISQSTRAVILVGLALAALTLTQCGKVTPSTPASGTFANVYSTVLGSACIECHVPGGSPTVSGSTLDFSTQATAYATLIAANAKISGGSACTAVKIVAPASPTTSYLAAVLFTDYNSNNFAGASGCVPYAAHRSDQNISTDQKTSIIAWIQSGALNN